MSTGLREYRSEFVRKYIYQGRAESLLAVLAARDIDVTDGVRDRITGCTDPDQLDRWIRRAVSVGAATELFD